MEISEIGGNKENLKKLSRECFGIKPKQTFLPQATLLLEEEEGRRKGEETGGR